MRTYEDSARELYETASHDGAWEAALRGIRESFGGTGAALMLPDDALAGPGLAAGDNLDPEAGAAYAAHYHRVDLWARAAVLAPTNRVMLGEELVPDRQLRASPWFNEFLRPFDNTRLLVLSVPVPGVLGGRGFLSIYRGERQKPFTATEKRAAWTLLPHARNALQLRYQRLAGPSVGLVGQFLRETSPDAAFLLDRQLRIIDMTRRAAQLLTWRSPCSVESGRLCIEGLPNLAERVQRFLRGPAGLTSRRTIDFSFHGQVWRAMFTDATPLSPTGDPLLGLLIEEPLARMAGARVGMLALRFALSPAEARLAETLLSVDSVNEAGERLGVSRETVKTQLRALRHKLHVNSTLGLVRRLAFEVGRHD